MYVRYVAGSIFGAGTVARAVQCDVIQHCRVLPIEGPCVSVLVLSTHSLHPVCTTYASQRPRLLLVRAGCQAVLVGSSSLALWDVVRQKRTAKLTGHTVRLALQGQPFWSWTQPQRQQLGHSLYSGLHVAFKHVALKLG